MGVDPSEYTAAVTAPFGIALQHQMAVKCGNPKLLPEAAKYLQLEDGRIASLEVRQLSAQKTAGSFTVQNSTSGQSKNMTVLQSFPANFGRKKADQLVSRRCSYLTTLLLAPT